MHALGLLALTKAARVPFFQPRGPLFRPRSWPGLVPPPTPTPTPLRPTPLSPPATPVQARGRFLPHTQELARAAEHQQIRTTPRTYLQQIYGDKLDEAVAAARTAQLQRGRVSPVARTMLDQYFPKWSPRRLDRPVTIDAVPRIAALPWAQGAAFPGARSPVRIEFVPQASSDGTAAILDHELTHAYATAGRGAAIKRQAFSQAHPTVAYAQQPTELDPVLATIKRRYFQETGRIVKTLADARDAIRWARVNRISTQVPQADEVIALQDSPIVWQRMTELVDNNKITSSQIV